MDKVYVVVGEEGSYSDRSEWLVAAYTDCEQADRHVKRCERYIAEIRAKYDPLTVKNPMTEDGKREYGRIVYARYDALEAHPFDQQCPKCYEVSYHVVEVPVAPLGHFAEFIAEDGG